MIIINCPSGWPFALIIMDETPRIEAIRVSIPLPGKIIKEPAIKNTEAVQRMMSYLENSFI